MPFWLIIILIKAGCYWNRNRQIAQWNMIKNLETYTDTRRPLTFVGSSATGQMETHMSFNLANKQLSEIYFIFLIWHIYIYMYIYLEGKIGIYNSWDSWSSISECGGIGGASLRLQLLNLSLTLFSFHSQRSHAHPCMDIRTPACTSKLFPQIRQHSIHLASPQAYCGMACPWEKHIVQVV